MGTYNSDSFPWYPTLRESGSTEQGSDVVIFLERTMSGEKNDYTVAPAIIGAGAAKPKKEQRLPRDHAHHRQQEPQWPLAGSPVAAFDEPYIHFRVLIKGTTHPSTEPVTVPRNHVIIGTRMPDSWRRIKGLKDGRLIQNKPSTSEYRCSPFVGSTFSLITCQNQKCEHQYIGGLQVNAHLLLSMLAALIKVVSGLRPLSVSTLQSMTNNINAHFTRYNPRINTVKS